MLIAGSTDDLSLLQVIPAAVSAIVTACAFVVTVLLYKRNRTDQVERQARHVYAWQTRQESPDGSWQMEVVVHNRSEAPIWRVEVLPLRNGRVDFDAKLAQRFWDVEPARSRRWTWPVDDARATDAYDREPRIVFYDSADRRWEKTGPTLKQRRSTRAKR